MLNLNWRTGQADYRLRMGKTGDIVPSPMVKIKMMSTRHGECPCQLDEVCFAHASPSGVRRQAKYASRTLSDSTLGTGPVCGV